MCLALPAKIVAINPADQTGYAELHGNRFEVNFVLVPQARVGDWALVHAGYAIQIVDPQEAAETWELLDEIMEYGKREEKA